MTNTVKMMAQPFILERLDNKIMEKSDAEYVRRWIEK